MTVQPYIQEELVRAIEGRCLNIKLPKLSPESEWRVQTQAFGLQYVGSRMLHVCVTEILLRMYPDQGASGPLADVMTVVTSQLTLYHVMKKVGELKESLYSKAVGDAFRTHMGAYQTEKGFDALYAWVMDTFGPLITVCEKARLQYHGTPFLKRPAEDHEGQREAKRYKNSASGSSSVFVPSGSGRESMSTCYFEDRRRHDQTASEFRHNENSALTNNRLHPYHPQSVASSPSKQPSSSTQALVSVSNPSRQESSSSFVSYQHYNHLRPEKSHEPTPHTAPISFNTSTTIGALPPSTATATETGTYNNPIVID